MEHVWIVESPPDPYYTKAMYFSDVHLWLVWLYRDPKAQYFSDGNGIDTPRVSQWLQQFHNHSSWRKADNYKYPL